MPPFEVPELGRIAVLLDRQGAPLEIFKPRVKIIHWRPSAQIPDVVADVR